MYSLSQQINILFFSYICLSNKPSHDTLLHFLQDTLNFKTSPTRRSQHCKGSMWSNWKINNVTLTNKCIKIYLSIDIAINKMNLHQLKGLYLT